MKIVVLDGQALNPGDLSWEPFRSFGDITVYDRTPTPEEAIARIDDAPIVLTNKTPITRSILDACPGIRLICVLATGYNVVDCAAAREKGIPVCNVPSYGTQAVAQFTMAMLLEICHRVGLHNHLVHHGKWCESENFCFWTTHQMELAGKTMGILGFGRIGQAVGKLAKAFGMEVLACSRTEYPQGAQIAEYVDFDTLLARSDVLSLHCPQTEETTGIINRETIAKMKDGAILINTARGGLLDDEAVIEALNTGKLRYAALDVIKTEPMEKGNPLLSAPNCMITPHMAWAPLESRQRLMNCVVENVRAFLSGTPQNVVN